MFDSHVHLDYAPFREGGDKFLARVREAGVTGVMNPSVDLDSARNSAELCVRYPWILPAVGIHPLYVEKYATLPLARLEELLSTGRFRAVGEIGLDYWEGRGNSARQIEFFSAQARLAQLQGLPILLHVRKAFYEVFTLLDEAGFTGRGVVHAFSGSWEMAKKALDRGFYLSICANITRPGKAKLRETVKRVPRERLLVETDAPDMPPHGHEGGLHYPWDLPITVAALAAALGTDPALVARFTEENARELFGAWG